MPEVTFSEWQAFVAAHSNLHLLQTIEWGELKSTFGWKPARIVSGDMGVQILFRKLPLGLTIGYIPKADTREWKEESEIWSEIDSVCKKHHAIFCKLESDVRETSLTPRLSPAGKGVGVRESPHNIQPPRSFTIDITGSEEDILARMKQKTRYNVRLAEKKGVTVRVCDHRALL